MRRREQRRAAQLTRRALRGRVGATASERAAAAVAGSGPWSGWREPHALALEERDHLLAGSPARPVVRAREVAEREDSSSGSSNSSDAGGRTSRGGERLQPGRGAWVSIRVGAVEPPPARPGRLAPPRRRSRTAGGSRRSSCSAGAGSRRAMPLVAEKSNRKNSAPASSGKRLFQLYARADHRCARGGSAATENSIGIVGTSVGSAPHLERLAAVGEHVVDDRRARRSAAGSRGAASTGSA